MANYETLQYVYTILIILSLVLVVLFFIVSGILLHTRTSTTVIPVTPTLQQLYDLGTVSNNLEVDNLVQPFNVSSSTRVQIQKDMIRFGNPAVMVTTVFGSQMLVGPVFQPQSFLTLTAVQYFRPLVAAETTRQVALVNMATIPRVNLLSPADSQFAPGTDVTENGLVTHNLTTPITLVAYAEYALIGVVSPTERWVENDDVAYSIDCNVTGTAVGSGIDPLEITQVDTPPTFHFFAFRTQAANVFNQIT